MIFDVWATETERKKEKINKFTQTVCNVIKSLSYCYCLPPKILWLITYSYKSSAFLPLANKQFSSDVGYASQEQFTLSLSWIHFLLSHPPLFPLSQYSAKKVIKSYLVYQLKIFQTIKMFVPNIYIKRDVSFENLVFIMQSYIEHFFCFHTVSATFDLAYQLKY